MRLFPTSSTLLRRTAVVVGAVALGIAAFAPASASVQHARPTINTFKDWDGGSTVASFGCPDTTTYGMTVKVPKGKHEIKKFTYYMSDFGNVGSMLARGEIYAWDGTKATGAAIAETAAKTIDLPDALFHPVAFKFNNATVTPGQQYVIFASIDKDYEACDNYSVGWGATDGTAYAKGIFVFQNNSGDESQWTATAWIPIPSIDAAMKVFMG